MFLRHTQRWKDGKEHYYWSLVENRRCRGNRIVQHTLLDLGEPEGPEARRQAAAGRAKPD